MGWISQGWQDWVLGVQDSTLIPFILGVRESPEGGYCELRAGRQSGEFQAQGTDCEGARAGAVTRPGSSTGLRQEDHRFERSLGYVVGPNSIQNRNRFQLVCCFGMESTR